MAVLTRLFLPEQVSDRIYCAGGDACVCARQALCHRRKERQRKTTLLSLLAGLALPTTGEVLFEGTPTAALDTDEYRRDSAAMIYQSDNLFPLLTAEENVLYPPRLKKLPRAEAQERAHRELLSVGIAESQFRRFPSQLSGGEQQRVSIARALAAGNTASSLRTSRRATLTSPTASRQWASCFALRTRSGDA